MRCLLGLGLIAVLVLSATAQLPTSTLNGTVTDPQGAAVANAKVSITSQATGVVRNTTSDTQGFYTFANVDPGDYTVRVESPSFAKTEIKDVRLEVGRASTRDVKLAMARAGEVVTVQAGEAQVDTTQSEVQGQIVESTVQNLPLNGRNFLELAFLLPGNHTAVNFDPTKTNTLEVSSAGQFGRGGNISVDGGDNNDEVVGGTLANFPEDAVREFQIATNRYTAEVGRSASSIINIVSKSGENAWHGSAFFFERNRKLTAFPPTLDRSACTGGKECRPPFDREQYGFSLGGPLRKDRVWWFASGENRHQNASVPVGFRDFTTHQVIASSAGAPLRDALLFGRLDFRLSDHDTVAARYDFNRSKDTSNGSLQGPAFGSAANRQSSLNRFHSPLVSWTRTIGANKVNSFIFHYDKFLNNIPAFSPNAPTFDVSIPGLGVNPQGGAAEIVFPGLEDGQTFRAPQRTRLDRWQLRDNFVWTRGPHTMYVGGEFQNFGSDILFDLFGSSSIFLTENFADADRNGDSVVNDLDIPIAAVVVSTAPVRPPSAPTDRNTYLAAYFQDDWRARSNLTFNFGLRYEYDTDLFGEGPLHKACPPPPTVPTSPCIWLRTALNLHRSRDPRDFGPRIGFSWDPFKSGKTVIRGGYGIYYDRVVLEPKLLELLLDGRRLAIGALNGSTCNGGGSCSGSGTTFDSGTPTLLNPYVGSPATLAIGLNVMDNNVSHPLVQQWTFGLQRQVGADWVLSADGIHNFGTRFIIGRLLRDSNNAPVTVTDPLSGLQNTVVTIGSFAKTWYDGLLVSLQKRVKPLGPFHYSFTANYTLSKAFNFAQDDQIPFGASQQADVVMGGNDLRLEKGYATTDERHRFVLFGVLNAPGDITVSPIWTYSSSVPGNPFVPEINARLPIIPRNSLARDIQSGAQLNTAIDFWNSLPSCPSTPTNAGPFPCHVGPTLAHVDPNAKFGDNFDSLDLRISKDFKISEQHRLTIIAEAFNLLNVTNIRGFNRLNYFGFDNNITSDPCLNGVSVCPAEPRTFNVPKNTAGGFFGSGGPRAFQFALRYAF
jgi:Carboxypeptidase regulatory-like domain/TonB dependent receptor